MKPNSLPHIYGLFKFVQRTRWIACANMGLQKVMGVIPCTVHFKHPDSSGLQQFSLRPCVWVSLNFFRFLLGFLSFPFLLNPVLARNCVYLVVLSPLRSLSGGGHDSPHPRDSLTFDKAVAYGN